MAFDKVKLSQIIKDFILTLDGDDYAANVSDSAIRNFALRGIREIGFDLGKKIKSLKRTIKDNDTIVLPDDYVDLVKIGVVDESGVIRVFGQNKNINYSEKYKTANTTNDSAAGPLDITANLVKDTEESKTATGNTASSNDESLDYYVFERRTPGWSLQGKPRSEQNRNRG
jgi:hypothetical protein